LTAELPVNDDHTRHTSTCK